MDRYCGFNYWEFCCSLSDIHFGLRIVSDWVNIMVGDWGNQEG